MSEIILNTATLPETLLRLISAEKVRVRKAGGEIRIVPISDNPATDKSLAIKRAAAEAEDKIRRLYDLCGSGADLDMTVDSFLVMTHDERELSDE